MMGIKDWDQELAQALEGRYHLFSRDKGGIFFEMNGKKPLRLSSH